MRKTIIIITVVVIVAIIVGIVLFVLRSPDTPSTSTPPASSTTNPAFPGTGGGSGGSGSGSIVGGPIDISGGNTGGSGNATSGGGRYPIKRISQSPVRGATTFGSEEAVNLTARYVEIDTGHVYDYSILGGSTERVSNTTIPRVTSVAWGNRGQSAILSYPAEDTDAILHYLIQLPEVGGGSSSEIEGEFIAEDITAIASAPTGFLRTECPLYLASQLSPEGDNDPEEVRRLQVFLNDVREAELSPSGTYTPETEAAVTEYQEFYAEDILAPVGFTQGTGTVGPGTRAHINGLHCERTGGRVLGDRAIIATKSDGKTLVKTLDYLSGETTTIFGSRLNEWRFDWIDRETLLMQTKPASSVTGYLYRQRINSNSHDGTLAPLLEGRGLTASVSPDKEYAIYSYYNGRGLVTELYDFETNSTREFLIDTLPADKCVWSSINSVVVYCASPIDNLLGLYPDRWYQGLKSFDDEIYRINVETETITKIYDPTQSGTGRLDVIDPFLSDEETHLFFTDKRDGYLWAIRIVELGS